MRLFLKCGYWCLEREDLALKDDVMRLKNEDDGLRSLRICKPSMPSISIMPNKNAKRTETTVVSKGLQLTVIAVFEVMGNSISISSSEIQCPANSGYHCIQSPCCACPFSVAAIKNQSIQSQNVVHSSPFFSLSLCFQLHRKNLSLW